jgi:hypothetical protein
MAMKLQTFRLVFNIFAVLIVGIVIAVLIDHLHYSWTGFLFNKAGLCEYKSLTVPVKNGFPQKTSFDFDLQSIAKEMLTNPNYEVSSYYKNRGVVISRKFGNINYQISFQNSRGSYEGFNLNTSSDVEEYSFPSVAGESCTTPNHILKENVFIMIKDLPLSNSQKDEMKKYVSVASVFRGNFW